MTASHGVIDLDTPDGELGGSDEGRAAIAGPRRKGAAYLVVASIVGMALGGVGGTEVLRSREERTKASTVTLVALPGSINSSRAMDGLRTMRLDAQLVLVNAGPSPITVQVEGARRPGVLLSGTGQSRLIRPGGTGWINVEVTLECATAFTSDPLPVNFSVRTADHRIRQTSYPIALQGPWQRACEPPPRMVSGPITVTR